MDYYNKCILKRNSNKEGDTNNSETTTVDVPNDGLIRVLNGRDLVLGENWELPDLSGAPIAAGEHQLAPMTCTFLVV